MINRQNYVARYQERANKARRLAKMTGFLLAVVVGFAAWTDSYLGPQLQTSVASTVNKFEDAGSNVNGADGVVSLLRSKLAL